MRPIFTLVIVAALSAGVATYNFFTEAAVTAGQSAERVVEKRRMPAQPADMVNLKNKKLKFMKDGKVVDDDAWLEGFAVDVRNISDKPITYIEVELMFPHLENQASTEAPPLAFKLYFGTREKPDGVTEKPSVKPGETVQLTLSEERYNQLYRILSDLNYPKKIVKVELTLRAVIFDDDLMWYIGNTMRRDPDNPDRWLNMDGPRSSARPSGEAQKKRWARRPSASTSVS